jgi:GDP/GTP exchange factor required for growth at low temperature
VSIDPQAISFDSPCQPEVFESLTPLPPSMQLEPLINVHKQRLIAGVIKDLVAGQHLASRVQFTIDKKLFQKCLRIRGLDADVMGQVYRMYCDPGSRPLPFVPL